MANTEMTGLFRALHREAELQRREFKFGHIRPSWLHRVLSAACVLFCQDDIDELKRLGVIK